MRTLEQLEEYNRKKAQAKAENYQWYKAHGICVECHQRSAVKGKTLCETCATKFNEHKKKSMQQRRVLGLCTRCGKPLSAEERESGYRMCAKCRDYNSRTRKKWYARHYGKKK